MSTDIPYTGPRFADQSLVTIDEIQTAKVEVPQGTVPYTVKPGDNLWTIATQNGYGDPPDMNAFYGANTQYSDRNPNEIYAGEVVFVKPPENGTVATGAVGPETGQTQYQNYQNGQPSGEPYYADAASNGQPAMQTTVNANGQEVRTDAQGNPANGYFLVNGSTQGGTYQRFENGVAVEGDTISQRWGAESSGTTNSETGAWTPPVAPSEANETSSTGGGGGGGGPAQRMV